MPELVVREVDDWRGDENALYRGDTRPPEEIRAAGGFHPVRPDAPDLRQHVHGATNAFVSTSTDQRVGEERAGMGALYVINAPGGIETDPTMRAAGDVRSYGESEVLFPGGIDWRYVKGWHEVSYHPGEGLKPGPFVPNPDYVGDRAAGATTPADTRVDRSTPDRPQEPVRPAGDQGPRNQQADPTRPGPAAQQVPAPTGPASGHQGHGHPPAQPSGHPGRPSHGQAPQGQRQGQPPPGQAPPLGRQHPGQPQHAHGHPGYQQPGQAHQDHAPPGKHGTPYGQQTASAGAGDFGPMGSELANAQADAARQEREAAERTQVVPRPDTQGTQQPEQGRRISLAERMERRFDDDRMRGLARHAQSTPAGMALFGSDGDGNQRYTAQQVPKIDGQFVVDAHGTANAARVGGSRLSPREVADLLRANPEWDGGPVTLLGCSTGKDPDGFAARLARELGVPVTAPDTDAWVDYKGNVYASSQAPRLATDADAVTPTWPPNGEWRTFSPDGGQTIHPGAHPPGHAPTWDGTPPATAANAPANRGDDSGERSGGTGEPEQPGDTPPRSVDDADGRADRNGQAAANPADVDSRGPDEAARARLEQLRRDWPELDRVLTDSPVTRDSLLSHPESVAMLDAALGDVQRRLDDAGVADAVRRDEITPEVQAKVDSIVGDLRAEDPNQVLDRSDQLAISREIAAGTTRDGYRQSGFDLSRREDPAYQKECVDRLRAEAPRVQEQLNRIVSEIAADNGGEASWRQRVKEEGRCLKKVREYVEEFPNGDASMLVDVAGAKIRFQSVDELYRALDALKNDPRVDIVRIKDRVANATKSGNRSILMNVRVDGHVAELKFGLKSFEAPAAAEHPLYEVRRDMDSAALAERREPTPVESLVKAATEAHARREYGAAWNREMAASRLHEVLTDHPDVASITHRLVADSVAHPTNVARSLADPATRDATIAMIGELADGRALGGRTLDEYRAANPGRGPLFEPVDPSVNTDADGRDRKAVLVDEAKRADPARDIGSGPTAEESAQLDDYARRLREDVHPAVEAEVRGFVEQVAPDASVSVRTKSAEGILDKVDRMTTGSPSRPPRPDYRAGDVIDAVGARITAPTMRDLARILEAAKDHFGVGDGGRILEVENMYASPKSKNPAYRVIPLVVRVDVDGLPYTFELQLTTQRASIAADLEHNTIFKPYVEMSATDEETVRRMLAEAAALDQEETR